MPDPVQNTPIPFGDWKPDELALNSSGSAEALNVVPNEGGYGPLCSPNLFTSDVLTDTVRGAYSVLSADDVVQNYAATAGGLFTGFSGAGFTQILTAAVSADYNWKLIRVNEQMVALHPGHVPVRHTVGTVVAVTNVGGSPPTAACGAQVGDFLMLGNLLIDPDDSNGHFPSRVRWGGFNNIDSPWISDPATQADFQDLPSEGGPVTAIAGRQVGTIFQARKIHRATYHGPPEIFDIVEVEDKRGAISDNVVDIGQGQFFIAEDGFFFFNGTNSQPIGDGRVNRYFFNRLNYAARNRICGAVDFVNSCVMWAFPSTSSGTLDEIIIYSYKENRWSHAQLTIDFLMSSAASNISIDALTDTLESYTISFDDDYFSAGGRGRLGLFSDTHIYGLFTGAPLPATIDTGEFTGPDGRRVFVNGVRPIVDVGLPSVQVQVLKRDQMIGQAQTFDAAVDQEIDGICPVIADARYMRFRTFIPGGTDWQHAVGIDIMRKATGEF